MYKPKIGIDWDDVTAPFNSIAIQMANEEMKIEPPLQLSEIDSWENKGRAGVIKRYYYDKRLYERQSTAISENVKAEIRKLMQFADVYFISAVYPDFMGIRASQILQVFPEITQDRIILGAAKHLVHFDITLDDNICNVLDSPAQYPVLMRKPWNRQMTGLLSVNSMKEFTMLVKRIYNDNERYDAAKPTEVVALVGPSGAGKNAVMDKLTSSYPESFKTPLSYTTNPVFYRKNNNKVFLQEELFNSISFLESTRYGGYGYGTTLGDIRDVVEEGKIAVMPLDICGAIGMSKAFNTLVVYVHRGKVNLIRNIVSDESLFEDEKTLRLLSLDAERRNKELCDLVINNDNSESYVEINNFIKEELA